MKYIFVTVQCAWVEGHEVLIFINEKTENLFQIIQFMLDEVTKKKSIVKKVSGVSTWMSVILKYKIHSSI